MAGEWITSALVEQFRRGGVARGLRLMAAQGLLPLKPEDLLELWADLASDPDGGVRAAAEKSLSAFPAAELRPILKSRHTPPGVLSCTCARRSEHELREAVLQNPSLPDEAIEALAPVLAQDLAELVVMNQTRLLRRTSLLVALESNAGLSADQKRRLRELRETFRIGETVAAAPAPTPPPEPEPQYHAELEPPGDVFMTEDEALVRYLSAEERQQPEKVSAVLRIYRLNTAEKLITALKGTREQRAILIRDPNRLVWSAVLSSPRLTEPEIDSFSAMTDVSDGVLRHIGNHREWTKRYSVLEKLVRNPRTPIGIAHSLRPRLNPRDIDAPSIARSVPDPNDPFALTSDELELLSVLGWLTVRVKRLLSELGGALGAKRREKILTAVARADAALDSGRLDGLRACVEEMRHTQRLLGRWLEPSGRALDDELSGEEKQRTFDVIETAKGVREARDEDAPGHSRIFTPEEQELLVRLSGWLVKTSRSYRRLKGGLTAEDRRQVESAIENTRAALGNGLIDDLQACVLEMRNVARLLDGGSEGERVSQGAPSLARLSEPRLLAVRSRDERAIPAEPVAHEPRDGWSVGGVDLYHALVRARLAERTCRDCGASLESAALLRAVTHVGTLLDELQLSDEGAARFLAAEDDLVVACVRCGARAVIPGGVSGETVER